MASVSLFRYSSVHYGSDVTAKGRSTQFTMVICRAFERRWACAYSH